MLNNSLQVALCQERFDSYEQVVRKLAEGWQPIGFVDMSPFQSPINDLVHPAAFEIESQIIKSDLDKCLYQCNKIRLGGALARQWGRIFEYTPVYFERNLDHTMIQDASDKLWERLGPPHYQFWGESPPLVNVGKYDIKFVARKSVIRFEVVLRGR